jgi:hypothetical protein
MELIIKIVIFHKNESCLIESFQYKSEQIYVLKVLLNNNSGFTNRRMTLKESEIGVVKEMRLNSEVMFKSFQVAISIRKSLSSLIIHRIIDFEDHIIIIAGMECKFYSDVFNKKFLSIGTNKMEGIKGF